MNEPDSSKTSGLPRTRGMREIRAEGPHLTRQLLLPVERFIYSETISGALLVVFRPLALHRFTFKSALPPSLWFAPLDQ